MRDEHEKPHHYQYASNSYDPIHLVRPEPGGRFHMISSGPRSRPNARNLLRSDQTPKVQFDHVQVMCLTYLIRPVLSTELGPPDPATGCRASLP
jgi:hypothetical protein